MGIIKILIIVQNLPVPFDRRVWMEATTLERANYQVSIISPQKYNYTKSYEVIENVNVFRYPLLIEAHKSPLAFLCEFGTCFLFTSYLSLKILLLKGFDIIHICNPPDIYFPLAFIYKLFRKKIIFDHHDLSPEMYLAKNLHKKESSFFFKLLIILERLTFIVSDVIIATNESHKTIAMTRGKKKESDIFVVRSGPNLSRFQNYHYDENLKNKKKYLVCYLGEMCEQDGVGEYLRQLDKYDRSFFEENVQMTFIGAGPDQIFMKNLAKNLNLDTFVNFTGRVSDSILANYLTTADLCFDTSPCNSWTDKSTMNKIIEYMAFEKTIISFDLKETKYSAGDAVVCIPKNNYNLFFKTMIELLINVKERNVRSAIGKKRFEQKMSWVNSFPNLLHAYDAAICKTSNK